MGGMLTAFAEDELQSFQLDPLVVTAQRRETSDLKTPAAVDVFTQEELQQTGASNLQDALKYGIGITYQAQGPKGVSQGTMTSKIIIRGVEKGTLVLVDGVSLNQSGRYNLDDIPLDSIERVEVIRGGGAVLFGSEATGGVINIITKGTRKNAVRTSFGNYGMQNHSVSAQMGKLGLTYSYDKLGDIDNISDPATGRPAGMYYNIKDVERNNFNWRYNFNDNIYFTHTYGKNNAHYVYRYDGRNNPAAAGADYKNAIHKTRENMMGLHYDKDGVKGVLYYNNRKQETDNVTARNSASSSKFDPANTKRDHSVNDDRSFGIDTSKRWDWKMGTALLGLNIQKDMLDTGKDTETDHSGNDYQRNVYSVYGQYGWNINNRSTLNINMRETWTGSSTEGQEFSKFLPEVEYLYELSDNSTLYAKAGRSFMLPTFSQIYGSGNIIANADLKPQHGEHYEVGLKRNIGNQAWRLAVYNYKINDFIESSWDNVEMGTVKYSNEDIKNTGIELTCDVDAGNGFTFNYGISYSEPKKRTAKDALGNSFEFSEWRNYYGKLQLNAGVTYTKDKFSGALNMNYLGKRTRDLASQESMRPQLFTDINLSYRPTESSRIYFNMDNILDRRDITTSSSSTYYTLGRNFSIGYEYSF